jgi:hypothetical protein
VTELAERRHGPGCECRRCAGLRGAVDAVPFAAGNTASVRHGAYSGRIGEDERTLAIADEVRRSASWITASDEPAVRLLAVTLCRTERAVAAIEEADKLSSNPLSPYLAKDTALKALRDDVRGWVRLAAQLASELGLTPTSRARLGLDVAQSRRALSLIDMAAGRDDRDAA